MYMLAQAFCIMYIRTLRGVKLANGVGGPSGNLGDNTLNRAREHT